MTGFYTYAERTPSGGHDDSNGGRQAAETQCRLVGAIRVRGMGLLRRDYQGYGMLHVLFLCASADTIIQGECKHIAAVRVALKEVLIA